MPVIVDVPETKLTSEQSKVIVKNFEENGNRYTLKIKIRFDDSCRNGHNSFAITADLMENSKEHSCGCLHDEIVKHAPELGKYIKWHLCSSNGPMYYLANTTFHVQDGKIDHARSSAIWQDAKDEDFRCTKEELELKLLARLPKLMTDFKSAIEELGFIY